MSRGMRILKFVAAVVVTIASIWIGDASCGYVINEAQLFVNNRRKTKPLSVTI